MISRFKRGTRALAICAACAACAAGAAACSSSSSGGGSSASGNLKIITWVNPPTIAAFKQIDSEFEKANPGIKVTLQTAADVNGPYKTLATQAVNSGTADIITDNFAFQPLPPNPTQSNETQVQFWGTNGAFTSLSGQSFLSSYTKGALASQTYKGKTYGLLSGVYQQGVFYNKAIFSRYHLTPPTTYNQFISEMNTLKHNNVEPLYTALGGVGPIYLQFVYNEAIADLWYPGAPGGNLAADLLHGTVKWTDPKFIQAMTEEKTVASYLEPNYTGVPWQDMAGGGDFTSGKAAMELDGTWDLASIHKASPNMQVGFFPLPFSNTAADNQPIIQNDLTFYVASHSKNQAAALKWLKFFSSPKIYAQYVNITGISSAETSGNFNGFSASAIGSWFGKGVNLQNMLPTMSPSNGANDQTATWPNLQLQVAQGKITPAKAAAEYQADWKTAS
ncbi:MAG TPA: extracellular solute-binding protein [Streptosporangiaceae bacterium]|jgi:raffinose/stachyose/melibiose transport system substrate-binding protein